MNGGVRLYPLLKHLLKIMLISVLVMVEQEKVIRLFITTEDVSKEKGDYHYIVNSFLMS